MCAVYKPSLPNVDTNDVVIRIWQSQWQNVGQMIDDRSKCSLTTLSQMSSDFYPHIKCFLILATLPITTVIAEQ